jgi:hypothetical protein
LCLFICVFLYYLNVPLIGTDTCITFRPWVLEPIQVAAQCKTRPVLIPSDIEVVGSKPVQDTVARKLWFVLVCCGDTQLYEGSCKNPPSEPRFLVV